MVLRLVGVLLSCGALCVASPVPPAARTGCFASSLIQETLYDVQTLNSEGTSKITSLNNTMEAGGNITTYLEGYIEALKSNKDEPKARQIAQQLQKILDDGKACLRGMEVDEEEEDLFSDLEYFLRFLNHNAVLEDTV